MSAPEWREGEGRRVTVFSLQGCPHCQKAKALLASLSHPYTEISLSEYPDKRADMLSVADRLTVPQIFFGDTHVGGAADLQALHDQGKLKAMLAETTPADAQLKPELQKPTHAPKPEQELPQQVEELVCLVGAECVTYRQMLEELSKGLTITNNSRGLRTHSRSFTGCDAVTFLVGKYSLRGRSDAVQAGDQLLQSGMIRHVEKKKGFEDSEELYRLQAHDEPLVLNRWRKSTRQPPASPALLLKSLAKSLRQIRADHTTAAGVDYLAVRADPKFGAFQDGTAELQLVDIRAMSEDARLAFVINLYNMAIIHAFCVVGVPGSDFQRLSFFDDVKYDVGGDKYSLNDLENGILRGNKRPPYHLSVPFGSSDTRKAVVLSAPDNRIHFALNCGAKSCPPVKDFTPEAVREELRIAASAFCNDMDEHVKVDAAAGVLWLSQIFNWYDSDFGGSGDAAARCVVEWLRGDKKKALSDMLGSGKLAVKYLPYDWSTDAAAGKHQVYGSASEAKARATGVQGKGCCNGCSVQ